MGGPDMAIKDMGAPIWPPSPQRSERPGGAVALLGTPTGSYTRDGCAGALSLDNVASCAECHPRARGGETAAARVRGVDGSAAAPEKRRAMNSPVRTVWRVSAAMALILALGIGLTGNSEAKHRADWFSAWGTSQQGLAAETVSDGTVRMIVRPTLSGTFVRVQLQNTFGTAPLTIGAAAIGARVNGAGLAPGSNRPLTFNGSPSVTIPAGGVVSSDPLAFAVHAWQDLAVSLYIPGTAAPISRHTNARKTSFWTLAGAGNHAADEAATAFAQTTTSMWWVAALDVFSSTADGTIVFFGDSITDGTATTTDGHDRWHDIVALRLM